MAEYQSLKVSEFSVVDDDALKSLAPDSSALVPLPPPQLNNAARGCLRRWRRLSSQRTGVCRSGSRRRRCEAGAAVK